MILTNEQIAASRDYNYSWLWHWHRQRGLKPAQIVANHERMLTQWYDREECSPSRK